MERLHHQCLVYSWYNSYTDAIDLSLLRNPHQDCFVLRSNRPASYGTKLGKAAVSEDGHDAAHCWAFLHPCLSFRRTGFCWYAS
eukprot:7117578-Pyramimonas_sp.AAC.1